MAVLPNDPGVNHFMVRTYVDPDDLRRDWLAVPSSPTDYPCVVERNGEVGSRGPDALPRGSGINDVTDDTVRAGRVAWLTGSIDDVDKPHCHGIWMVGRSRVLGTTEPGRSLLRATPQ